MIEHFNGDIFTHQPLTHIVHQANLYNTFGSGIAKNIKDNYTEAYNADLSTEYGDASKLGSFSSALVQGPWDQRFVIINLYSQIGISSTDRTTSYPHMEQGFKSIATWLLQSKERVHLGIPHGIGCGLAGGDWGTVDGMLGQIFADVPFDVTICKL